MEKNGQIVNKIWEQMFANCQWHHGCRRLTRRHCHHRRHWRKIQTIQVSCYSENPLCFNSTQSSSDSSTWAATKRVLHIIRHWSTTTTKVPWDISNESSSYFCRCAHMKSNTKSPITIEMWKIKRRPKKRVPRPNVRWLLCIGNSSCNTNSSYRSCVKRQHLQSSYRQPLCTVDDQQQHKLHRHHHHHPYIITINDDSFYLINAMFCKFRRSLSQGNSGTDGHLLPLFVCAQKCKFAISVYFPLNHRPFCPKRILLANMNHIWRRIIYSTFHGCLFASHFSFEVTKT